MIDGWDDRERHLREEAERDLTECCEDVHPRLVAFRGDDPLFDAQLRPHDKGDEWPLYELLVLAAALRADRVALLTSARVWSTEDPVPPVVPGAGDLRQRVILVHSAEREDGAEIEVRDETMLVAFETTSAGPRWAEPIRLAGASGRIAELIAGVLTVRDELAATPDDVREQLDLCVLRGHVIAVPDRVARELGLESVAG